MPAITLGPARPAATAATSPPRDPDEMLATLYAHHGSALRRFAARLSGDHSHAEDIVQETMLRAWRHPESVGGRTGPPLAWLYTVARHLAIDQHRARRAHPTEPAGLTVQAGRAAPDQIDAAIAQWDLATALASLRPRDRDLLTAHYLRDRSIGQIAADLTIPAGTVKSRLSAARAALRRNLQSTNGSPGRGAARALATAPADPTRPPQAHRNNSAPPGPDRQQAHQPPLLCQPPRRSEALT